MSLVIFDIFDKLIIFDFFTLSNSVKCLIDLRSKFLFDFMVLSL